MRLQPLDGVTHGIAQAVLGKLNSPLDYSMCLTYCTQVLVEIAEAKHLQDKFLLYGTDLQQKGTAYKMSCHREANMTTQGYNSIQCKR